MYPNNVHRSWFKPTRWFCAGLAAFAGLQLAAPRLSLAEGTAAKTPPGVVIDHSPAASKIYIGSPSIAVLPNGDYLASHDLFGPKSNEKDTGLTRVFRSTDKGETWTHLADVENAFWSTLFVHDGNAYLIGPTKSFGNMVIHRSTDGGKTWTDPTDKNNGLLLEGQYHCAPVPVVVHNGRIWRAVEDAAGGTKWGVRFRAMMMSAPVNADLLNADSWTHSNILERDPQWLNGTFNAWLEGNAVITPEGKMVDILRVDGPEDDEYAAIIQISDDGKTATFDPASGFVHFPGGATKFTIRFDPQTKLYWSLANYVPPDVMEQVKSKGPDSKSGKISLNKIRNTLALISSPDLKTWTVRSIICQHPDFEKHGFQYVDWLFDGNDIIAASRTAYDDNADGANSFHNANYLTFHRIENFRDLKMPPTASTTSKAGSTMNQGRAATSSPSVIHSEFIFEKAPFMQCHASTIAETPDHTLVAAWFGGTRERNPDVSIWLAQLTNGHWSAPVEVASGIQREVNSNGGELRFPCWNPVLYQPRNGPLMLFYKVGPDPKHWWGLLTSSDDGGQTWNIPRRLPDGILGPIKNKPVELSNGSLLCPTSTENDHWQVSFEITPDLGQTWRHIGPVVGEHWDAIQPSVLQLADGNLLALCRSQQGRITETRSLDNGNTWSHLTATELPNPNSGIDAVTLSDGRQLLVYNHTEQGRSPLNVAVSNDGVAWHPVLVLENEPGEYSYPAVIQSADGRVHITYTWRREKIRHVVLDPIALN
jgi:predicted neuraminidase